MARVKNPANAHGRRRLDGAAVQAYGVCGRVVRRNEQQLVGAFECLRERRWVGVVALTDRHPSVREPLGLGDIADGDGDVLSGNEFQEVVDGRAVERAGCSGNDDHARAPPVIDGIT